MNRSKRLFLLLGILAAACLITFGVSRYEDKQEDIRESGETVLTIDPESVTALSWEVDGAELSFHRDEGWVYDGDAAFPVDADKIAERLALFESFNAAFTIENVDEPGQYGLDEPQCAIHITADGETHDILLGDYSAMDSRRYVSTGDGRVYLAVTDPLDMFTGELSRLIKNDATPDISQAARISFTGAENYEIIYESAHEGKSLCDEDVYYADGMPLDTNKVKSYLRSLSSLGLGTYAAYNVDEDKLSFYGLDSPTLTIAVDYEGDSGESESFTISLGQNQKELKVAEENSEEDADAVQAYACVGESRIVYEITSESFKALCGAGYDTLRHSELFPGDFDEVKKLVFSLDGEEYSFEYLVDEEDTSLFSSNEAKWYYDGEELDIDPIEDAIAALTAESFTDEAKASKDEVTLTIVLENEEIPEVKLTFCRYDGACCLAIVDGTPTALVARDKVMALKEAAYAVVLGTAEE